MNSIPKVDDSHSNIRVIRQREAGCELPSGHNVQVDPRDSTVRITNAAGLVELRVRCTSEGCILEFGSVDLAVTAQGKVTFECDDLQVHTREHLALSSAGDMVTQVAGSAALVAEDLALEATCGDAVIKANDYVSVLGEQILLNSEQSRKEQREQFEAFWKLR